MSKGCSNRKVQFFDGYLCAAAIWAGGISGKPVFIRVEEISCSEVSENTSKSTRWPFSHTRYILQLGCSAQELEPSVQTLSVIGRSTASIMSRNEMFDAGRAS